uniref:Uncharacterized protein n=1 Tax=Knipowitschia caucasica TaxID=637954 RepID=A0AAV2L167_KNICA
MEVILQILGSPIRLNGAVRDDGTARWDLEWDGPFLRLFVDLGLLLPSQVRSDQERHFWGKEFLWRGPLRGPSERPGLGRVSTIFEMELLRPWVWSSEHCLPLWQRFLEKLIEGIQTSA